MKMNGFASINFVNNWIDKISKRIKIDMDNVDQRTADLQKELDSCSSNLVELNNNAIITALSKTAFSKNYFSSKGNTVNLSQDKYEVVDTEHCSLSNTTKGNLETSITLTDISKVSTGTFYMNGGSAAIISSDEGDQTLYSKLINSKYKYMMFRAEIDTDLTDEIKCGIKLYAGCMTKDYGWVGECNNPISYAELNNGVVTFIIDTNDLKKYINKQKEKNSEYRLRLFFHLYPIICDKISKNNFTVNIKKIKYDFITGNEESAEAQTDMSDYYTKADVSTAIQEAIDNINVLYEVTSTQKEINIPYSDWETGKFTNGSGVVVSDDNNHAQSKSTYDITEINPKDNLLTLNYNQGGIYVNEYNSEMKFLKQTFISQGKSITLQDKTHYITFSETWINSSYNLKITYSIEEKKLKDIPSVADDLTTTDQAKALSAKQGKVLNDKIALSLTSAKEYTDSAVENINFDEHIKRYLENNDITKITSVTQEGNTLILK